MRSRNRINPIKTAFTVFAAAGLCFSCSSDKSDPGMPEAQSVRLAPVQEGTMTRASQTPPDGNYYLEYTSGSSTAMLHDLALVDGVIQGETPGAPFESGLYWVNIQKEAENKATFTLSNMSDAESGVTLFGEKDILWSTNTVAWGTAAGVAFELQHRMAQVVVEFTFDEIVADEVDKVSLLAMQTSYTFTRADGTVTPVEAPVELELTRVTGTDNWSALLPPQARTNDMTLRVESDTKAYQRPLPYNMSEDLGGGNSQSIPLAFRSGYILALTAGVTNNIDYKIHFSGATLKNWQYLGSNSVVAKPAGLYTESELNDWATKYNAYRTAIGGADEQKAFNALLRYGEYASSQWTFTVRRKIAVANPDALTKITNFVDKLDQADVSYTINIDQADLITNSTGTIPAGLFPGRTTP